MEPSDHKARAHAALCRLAAMAERTPHGNALRAKARKAAELLDMERHVAAEKVNRLVTFARNR